MAAVCQIIQIDSDTNAWDEFVQTKNNASIYHLSVWKKLINQIFGHSSYYLQAMSDDGNVVGVLPLVRLKSMLFGDYIVSMPFFNYGGVLADSPEIESALMKRAGELAAELGVQHIEFRDTVARDSQWPVREDKVVMELALPDSEDALWSSIGSKVRAQVKRPQREGVEIRCGGLELVDDFYRVFSENMRDLGTPVYSKSLFTEILKEFPDNSYIVLVYHAGGPVAAGFLLGFNGRLEIPWASSLRKYNRIGVNMALYWNVLKLAIARDYKVFDFGRSTVGCGTYRFKKQWGAEPKQLYWHYWLKEGGAVPQLNPDNPKYKMAINAWQRLPLGVSTWLGPKIVKNLP